jgi:hypothetical protein
MLAQHRILSVGTDAKLLSTRQTLLSSRGYDTMTATLDDVEEIVLHHLMASPEFSRDLFIGHAGALPKTGAASCLGLFLVAR